MSPIVLAAEPEEFGVDIKSRIAEVAGYGTHYLHAGRRGAPRVLLLHDGAFGGSAEVTWGALIGRLARQYEVFAPDLLGFGKSDKVSFFDRSSYDFRQAHLRAFVRDIGGDDQMHVVGSSYGGSLALRMAASTDSEWMASATSFGGTGGGWRTALSREELSRWDGTRDDMARLCRVVIDDGPWFEPWVDSRFASASEPGHYRALMSASMALPEKLRIDRVDTWPDELSLATTPILLVRGRRDLLLEADWTDRLKKTGARIEVKELDSQHAPNIDHPGETLALIDEFVRAIEL